MAKAKTVLASQSPKMSCKYEDVVLEEDHFDFLVDKTTGQATSVRQFTWTNGNGVVIKMITYGATITSIKLPDRNGKFDDIVLGYNNIAGYLSSANPYFGATVGRVANRIGGARINIDQATYALSANLGRHQLHGGFKGFDKYNWDYYVSGNRVVFSLDSADGDEGYPGNVLVNVSCELTNSNEFLLDFSATTTKPTVVNLTNHSYFNLAGHEKGAQEIYKHEVSINADRITEVDEDFIPTGKLLPVCNTIFDLRIPKQLGSVIHKVPVVNGYDHNFCINRASEQQNTFVSRIQHYATGRALEVYSNQYGVQFYTSNGLPEDPKDAPMGADITKLQKVVGKDGANYYKHSAICLETQNYPDAVNQSDFPKAILYPGETYHHTLKYKFIVE
ncbi:PREDICTED: aldose 1-epimerase [Nicrophorus vespilloides]|uniref:Aldose 1-epimerase n=1 Tax=Nicrophorus vespilloides TaxID=110193 RepID=A0ABM1M1M1_NICVS|nr:PREDICTED: aldose 1-epimerase [Nicrophorus vespilloides]